MSTRAHELLEQILALPSQERAVLAQKILATLDPTSPRPAMIETIERMSASEAEARLDAYERGEITALSEEEAMAWLDEQGSA